MQDEDNIIKNPHRNNKSLNEPYVPEYVRLGVNPIIKEFSSLDGEEIPNSDDDHFVEPSVEMLSSHRADVIDDVSDNNDSVQSSPISPEIGEYILMVDGTIISCGTKDYITSQAKSILYGEHADFPNQRIAMEQIVLLKRVDIKVGVFIDE